MRMGSQTERTDETDGCREGEEYLLKVLLLKVMLLIITN